MTVVSVSQAKVVVLGSSVCPLWMRQETCVGFLEGDTGTCPPVSKTGLCPSSRTVSGSYVLRETLRRLSADGWGYVSTFLIVYPEVSQQRRLQAVC